MAVSNQTSQIEHAGNESAVTPYPIPFRYDDPSWIAVEVVDEDGGLTLLEAGADYTITPNGTSEAGEVVTIAGIPATSVVRISRNTPFTQLLSLTANGVIPTVRLVAALDKLTMAMIDQERRMTTPVVFNTGGVVHLPEGETPTVEITGTWPNYTINFGLPTGATGGLNVGEDAGFGTLPNNEGGPAFAFYDYGTGELKPVGLMHGAFVVLDFES